MNNEIDILKDGIRDYCDSIYAMSVKYMRDNNISFDLSDSDKLSELLREIDEIKKKIIDENNKDVLTYYKDRVIIISVKVDEIVGI